MEVKLLKDVLIEAWQIDVYFDGHVPLNLWRALNRRKAQAILDFVEEPFVLSNGRPWPADVRIIDRGGMKWVSVSQRPRGVSTFDRPGVPPGRD